MKRIFRIIISIILILSLVACGSLPTKEIISKSQETSVEETTKGTTEETTEDTTEDTIKEIAEKTTEETTKETTEVATNVELDEITTVRTQYKEVSFEVPEGWEMKEFGVFTYWLKDAVEDYPFLMLNIADGIEYFDENSWLEYAEGVGTNEYTLLRTDNHDVALLEFESIQGTENIATSIAAIYLNNKICSFGMSHDISEDYSLLFEKIVDSIEIDELKTNIDVDYNEEAFEAMK